MDSGVEFIAVDNPHANKLTVHILAAVAQHDPLLKVVDGWGMPSNRTSYWR